MRISITVEMHRPARRTLALVAGVLLLTAPAVVVASHQFTDVPTGHPFHDEISSIAGAGITTGFQDGTYRPSDNLTRQAMAAFLERGLGRAGLTVNDALLTPSLSVTAGNPGAVHVPVQDLTIDVPGATATSQQWVYVRGRVTFASGMHYAVDGCPCEMYAFIRDMTTSGISGTQYQTFESASTANVGYFRSFDVEGLFPALPGPRTFRMEVGLARRETVTSASTFPFDPATTVSAMIFPFGFVENPNEP